MESRESQYVFSSLYLCFGANEQKLQAKAVSLSCLHNLAGFFFTDIKSGRWSAKNPWSTLKVASSILNSILCFTANQWRYLNFGICLFLQQYWPLTSISTFTQSHITGSTSRGYRFYSVVEPPLRMPHIFRD